MDENAMTIASFVLACIAIGTNLYAWARDSRRHRLQQKASVVYRDAFIRGRWFPPATSEPPPAPAAPPAPASRPPKVR